MKDTLLFIWLAASLMSGCIRTESRRSLITKIEGTPYRKILVCCPAGSAAVAAKMESIMSVRLLARRVAAETCSQLLYPMRQAVLERGAAAIKEHGFDGVLVLQREAIGETGEPVPGENAKRYSDLQDFIKDYASKIRGQSPESRQEEVAGSEETTYVLFGRDRIIHGRADLIGLRENRIVWATSGTSEGSKKKPLSQFLQSFAEGVEGRLVETGIIPEK